ncbi:Mov34/MPN/PAD-1 family protein, partial [Acinetobacter baumannii]
QVLGYWHSHPSGRAEPSAEDARLASGDARVWAIVAGGAISLWRDTPQGFVALSYTAADG